MMLTQTHIETAHDRPMCSRTICPNLTVDVTHKVVRGPQPGRYSLVGFDTEMHGIAIVREARSVLRSWNVPLAAIDAPIDVIEHLDRLRAYYDCIESRGSANARLDLFGLSAGTNRDEVRVWHSE